MAAGSPTLFSTASGVIGLIAGPFSALRTLDFQVRPLGSLQRVVATPAGKPGQDTFVIISASSPFCAGSATAFGGALAQCHGSDLLPLRLPLFTSQRYPLGGIAGVLEAGRNKAEFRMPPGADAHFVSLCSGFPWAGIKPPESLAPC
jgi:hypothetical protein